MDGLRRRGALFVPDADPVYPALPDSIAQWVQGIADHVEGLLYADILEDVDDGSVTVRDMDHLRGWRAFVEIAAG